MITNDIINTIMDYETGKLADIEVLEMFDELEETGLLYKLQGSYRRVYSALEREGLVGHGSEQARAFMKGEPLNEAEV